MTINRLLFAFAGLGLFLAALGVDPEPVEWDIGPWEGEREWQERFSSQFDRPLASIVVATSKPAKDWLPERWAELSDALYHDFGLQPLIVGGRSDLHFAFTDATTGKPVEDLKPFLAAAGHVVVMRADGETFAHEHAEVEDADGRPVFALPGERFGPELDVHAEFDTPGVYQLWGQFRLADGEVLTVPVTVEAS